MAAISERGGKYLARVRRDGFKSVAKTFTLKKDALAWARRVEADMEAGRWVEADESVPTLSKAIEKYEKTVSVRLKGGSDYAYRYALMMAEGFALKPINEVTARDLSAWRDRLMDGRKPATVQRLMALLSAVFAWAVKERGWLSENPMAKVNKPRVADGRDRVLSPEEVTHIAKAAQDSRVAWLSPVLVILMTTAMRRGELFSLNRSDVDFKAKTAHLSDTKAGVPRDVPLCPEALQALQVLDRAAEQRKDESLLPLTDAGSVSMTFGRFVRRARAQYEQDCTAKGIRPDPKFLADLRLHDLRHHAVTQWASTGALSVVELMAISGHRNTKMLVRYTHLSSSALADKMAKIAA